MKKLILLLVLLTMIGFAPARSEANSITFDFNSIISGKGIKPVSSLGTLTLTESGNSVVLAVNLSNSNFKILELDLNFNDAKFSNHSALTLLNKSLQIGLNSIRADGYPGRFDISIPRTGNIGTFGTYTDTMMFDKGASKLSISDLSFKDTTSQLFASIHIGNFSGGSSVWSGATSPVAKVPEPSTLILLGFGLLALAFLGKRLGYSPNAGR